MMTMIINNSNDNAPGRGAYFSGGAGFLACTLAFFLASIVSCPVTEILVWLSTEDSWDGLLRRRDFILFSNSLGSKTLKMSSLSNTLIMKVAMTSAVYGFHSCSVLGLGSSSS